MLSRRQFLQAAGIAVAAAHLPRLDFPTPAAPSFDAVYGRALGTTPVYAAPTTAAPLIDRLWSDTVVPVYGADGGWYRLIRGYARSENVQPMSAPAHQSSAAAAPPFWAEVTGALAIVRAFCAADAPVIARVGHGGVLRVIDYLPGDGIDWYGVAESDDAALLGWAQTTRWSPAQIDAAPPTLSLDVRVAAQRLTVREGDRVLLTAPISTGHDLPSGVFPVTERHPTAALPTDQVGVPWSLTFSDCVPFSGAYWHNRFGMPAPGAALQVTPPLAKWLYPRVLEVIIS
jgi:hypothetical protein